MVEQCDIAIIGGGPAGSTAAYELASKGWKVVVFEQEKHPRFHIGESLLPMNLPVFEHIGVLEQVQKVGVFKPGAEFYNEDTSQAPCRYYFRDSLDKSHPNAFQVRRDQLDEILIRNAEKAGAEINEETRVLSVTTEENEQSELDVQSKDGVTHRWQARYVIDASGRDTLLGRQHKLKKKNTRHASAAIFGHFRNVQRHEGEDSGLITVCWFEHGWIWMIPLPDGIMSIGAVCDPAYLRTRKSSAAEFLQQTLELVPQHVRQRLETAELIGEARATGNYSYQCSEMIVPGAILIGDAWAFVDPVFSSGVLLGMRSGLRGAAYVDAKLQNTPQANKLKRAFNRETRQAVAQFSWIISRFNSPGIRHLFMNPQNPLRVQEAVTSLLAGDIDRHNGVRPRLLLFRLFYYVYSLGNWRSSLADKKQRLTRASTEFRGGTTDVDQINENRDCSN